MAVSYRQDLTLSLEDLTGLKDQLTMCYHKFHSPSKLFSYMEQ